MSDFTRSPDGVSPTQSSAMRSPYSLKVRLRRAVDVSTTKAGPSQSGNRLIFRRQGAPLALRSHHRRGALRRIPPPLPGFQLRGHVPGCHPHQKVVGDCRGGTGCRAPLAHGVERCN